MTRYGAHRLGALSLFLFLGLASGCRSPRLQSQPPAPPAPRLDGRLVIVDAGHGGEDPGAIASDGTREKDVTREIADRVAAELVALGAEVLQSRPGDATVSLDARVDLARHTGCDLFVSVHADAAERAEASGPTVFLARGALQTSESVGRAIEARLAAAGLVTRGVQSAGFRVLIGHPRPSVLVECGFLTNAAERALLIEPAHQVVLARAIASGIVDAMGTPTGRAATP